MFLDTLFDTGDFPARWHCGTWTDLHGWTHICADIAIWGAYMTIPLMLGWFIMQRKNVPFPKVAWLFVAFIFVCGNTHLIEATIFWNPWYRFSGLLKVSTALVSWATVLALVPIIPRALSLPGLADVNTKLRKEIAVRRAAESRFSKVFEASPGAMLVVDAEHNISMANALVEEIFGHTRDELLGRPVQTILPHYKTCATRNSTSNTEQSNNRRELSGLHKLGHQVQIEIGCSPLEMGDEFVTLLVLSDITQRKQKEARLLAITAELERSNHDLEEFAYVASHDLKAPLRAIKNLATWVVEDTEETLSKESLDHLDTLQGRVLRMERLLQDLLDYSRVGKEQAKVEQVDINEVVQNAIDLTSLPESFSIIAPKDMPTLHTTRVPLELVFRNLFSNAFKHHDKGTGQVIVSWEDLGDKVAFCVSDDGPGIESRYYERIFQMFKTLKRRDEVEGSGMGLALIKKIIETQGGEIGVSSTLGEGSTFRFTWPKTHSETAPS